MTSCSHRLCLSVPRACVPSVFLFPSVLCDWCVRPDAADTAVERVAFSLVLFKWDLLVKRFMIASVEQKA